MHEYHQPGTIAPVTLEVCFGLTSSFENQNIGYRSNQCE